MPIDPTRVPILGDTHPVDPPPSVRAASALLIALVALLAAHVTHLWATTGQDLSLFVVPSTLLVWFALGVRAGRDWARASAVVVACVELLVVGALSTGPLDVVVLLTAIVLATNATTLMYRQDTRDYFETDAHTG